jgi:hypothetical protein
LKSKDRSLRQLPQVSSNTQILRPAQIPVGAGLPAMAVCQAILKMAVPASSLAAPTGFKQYSNIAVSTNPCGSWLASDGGVSGDIEGGGTGLIAGKPAPTGFVGYPSIAATSYPCADFVIGTG